jgi:hypothetical protein
MMLLRMRRRRGQIHRYCNEDYINKEYAGL